MNGAMPNIRSSHACHLCTASVRRNDGGEVMGQVGHLRAQLLRQEQEMQLMRTKLLEVNEEREKAEKKVR